ncbi:hypothetical protein KX816_00265 [Sphingosinicellaceae bacterium]|nr:hypothetical protein KX816_00265 [Sphingosinicellaceae bacterium]
MGRTIFWIFVVIALIVVAGAIYLATADVPAPVTHVEKLLPNAPSAP